MEGFWRDIGNMVEKVGQLVMDGKDLGFLFQMIYGSNLSAAGGDAEGGVFNSLKLSD